MSKPENPKRILYVDTAVSIAGGQVSLIEILRLLDTLRFTPVVCSPANSRMRTTCEELGVAWLPIPVESVHVSTVTGSGPFVVLRDLVLSIYSTFYLCRLIWKNRIDIVHTNNFKAALIGGLASLLSGRPMIFHDRVHITHGILGRLVALLAARIIVVSRAVGTKHRGFIANKVRLIRDGIDVDRFTPSGGAGPGDLIGSLGRISEEKGIIDLVESAPLILDQVPDASFAIGGAPFTPDDEVYLERIKRRIGELGLSEKFRFPGYVEDARGFLESVSVLALPSKNEPLRLVPLEAMALGKPVVSFDIGGPREIISNRVDGVLVGPGDRGAFAQAIADLLKDPQTARQMGARGRQTVAKRFSHRVFVDTVMRLYDEICHSPAASDRAGESGRSGV